MDLKKLIYKIILIFIFINLTICLTDMYQSEANAVLVWPVPGHTSLSQYFHNNCAIDISAPEGAQIVAAMEGTVSMDVETVKGGLGNKLVGGEGFFNTKVTGPGKVWLQTMPVSQLADAIKPFIPTGR